MTQNQKMSGAGRVRWARHACLTAVTASMAAYAGGCGPTTAGVPDSRQVGNVRVGSSQGGGLASLEIENEMSIIDSVIPVAPAAAWSVLADVFVALGIEASTADRRSMAMGNERFIGRRIDGRPLSDFVDCGTYFGRPRADQYEVTMQVLVRLTPASDGTRVETALDAYARPRDVAGNALHCTSRGTLERKFPELILARSAN